jgi:hypothetical protein
VDPRTCFRQRVVDACADGIPRRRLRRSPPTHGRIDARVEGRSRADRYKGCTRVWSARSSLAAAVPTGSPRPFDVFPCACDQSAPAEAISTGLLYRVIRKITSETLSGWPFLRRNRHNSHSHPNRHSPCLNGKSVPLHTEAFAHKGLVIVDPSTTDCSGKTVTTGNLHDALANCKT